MTALIGGAGARRLLSVLVVLAVTSGMVVAVVRAEGYHAPAFQLHDAGIWVTQRSTSSVGRLNTELEILDTKTNVGGADQDILQSGASVLVRQTKPDRLLGLNVRTGQLGGGAVLPSEATLVRLGGSTAAVLDLASGKLWIAGASKISSQTFTENPTAALLGARDVAVGLNGVVHVLVVGDRAREVVSYRADGTVTDRRSLDPKLNPDSITAVGSRIVVLDSTAGTLVEPGRRSIQVADLGPNLRLQEPGPAHATVLVAGDHDLAAVPIDGGPIAKWSGGGGNPVPPVRLGSCTWAAWQAQPTKVRACDGKPPEGGPIDDPKIPPNSPLQFRINRNRVVLNQLVSGTILLVDDGETRRVDDWTQALAVDQDDDGSRDPNARQAVLSNQRAILGGADPNTAPKPKENVPPKANDDAAATRERRPVIIRVLENDVDPGDVLVVESLESPATDAGVASIVDLGNAVQFSPAAGRVQPVVFRYTISDGRGGTASARVTVTIRPREVNTAPETVRDEAMVDAGRTVTRNVLANDRDAEGDALTLTKVTAPQGSVQFRPDGTVVFTAPGTAVGQVTLTYEVADEINAKSTGEFRVDVVPAVNHEPLAASDHVQAFVGREAVLNVLANDSDPDGDPLTVFRVDNQSGLSVQWLPSGEMRLKGDKPGSFILAYDITDGPKVASALVRVDVQKPGAQRPPVAVRDDVVLRPGVATLVPVLANDSDPDGDVLVIERVDTDAAAKGLVVETVEHRALRLIATSPLTESLTFTYTVSDGTAQAVGTVVVRSIAGGVNQPPITNRDELAIRAGNITAIRVLANDVDPDGDEMTLVAVSEIPPSDGILFLQGNQLRYQAPEAEKGAVLARYTVADSAGNKADGEVVIHVTPLDASRNSPPTAATIEARVVGGTEVTINIPLVGIDPEGDTVTFLGFGDPPSLGTILETTPNSMRYAAARESAGTDRFTYRLRDSLGAEATGSVLVGVIAPPRANNPPVAVPDRATVQAGQSVRVDVLANDSDPDGDSIELLPAELGQPSRGAVSIEGADVVFTSRGVSAGTEVSFEYVIIDSRGASAHALATVAVTAEPAAQPPFARDDLVAPKAVGTAVEVDVLDNDEDPDGDVRKLRVSVEGQPGVSVVDGKLRFTMADKAMNFPYVVTDPQNLTARAFVQVPLADADLPPVAEVDRAETEFNQPVTLSVLANDKDPEGKPLSLTKIVGTPRNGTAQPTGNQVVFSPQKDFAGEGGFSYEVSDGKNTAQGSAVVVVKAQANRPPQFVTTDVEIPASGKRDVDLARSVDDPDAGDKATFSNVRSANSAVTAGLNGATLTVAAAPGAKGQESKVTFDLTDGKPDGKAEGSINVKVLANDKPLPSAVNDTARTLQDKPVNIAVLTNDTDPAGVGLRLDSVTPGSGGSPQVQADQVVFTPAKDFFGQASFTYTVFDKTGEPERTAKATVSVAVIGRPSAPAAPTGSRQDKSATLQWAAPSANGAPIDKYEVQTEAGASQNCTFTSATACTVGGLTNGSTYRFQVRALNEAGAGPWSASSPDLIPDIIPSIPSAPTGRFGDRQMSVSWTSPANEGTSISEYTLEISPPPPSGAGSQTIPGATTSYVWTGLMNGTGYRFRVKARNGAGSTEFGAYGNTEIPAGPPFTPAAPTAIKGDRQVTVNYVEPGTNGDAIQSYELQIKKNGSLDRTDPISDPTVRSRVVTADNGASYTFAIRAANKAGPSQWSPDSPVIIPCGKAAAVTGVQATEGDTNSTLSFADPSNNGCAITSFKYRPTGGSAQTLAASKVVGGLTNGTNYSFEVQACNSEGCGDFGPASNTVNPYGLPGQPGVSGSVNVRRLNWSWNTPSGNGRPVTGFNVFVDGNLVAQDLSTSYGQDFGYSETHTLSVEAVNARGASTPRSSSQQRTADPPPRTVTISKGAQHIIQPGPNGNCTSPQCTNIDVRIENFAPNQTVQVRCYSSVDTNGASFWTYNMNTGNGSNTSSTCVHGDSRYTVYVTVDGVRSNTISG